MSGLQLLPDGDVSVEYRVTDGGGGDETYHQDFAGGALVACAPGPAADPDLVLRQPRSAHVDMVARRGVPEEIASRTEVVDPGSGAARPAPPFDEVVNDWGAELVEIPGAESLLVLHTHAASPFGDVTTWFRIERGLICARGLGRVPGADVEVVREFGLAIAERAGQVGLVESVNRGAIDGEFKKVAMFFGLYESEECVRGRRRLCRPGDDALTVLARLMASGAWAPVAEALRASFDDDVLSLP